jgi:hypothetical protein
MSSDKLVRFFEGRARERLKVIPGFPERLAFATLTCSPWRWVLVAPSPLAPEGFVNVSTGETHPVVW